MSNPTKEEVWNENRKNYSAGNWWLLMSAINNNDYVVKSLPDLLAYVKELDSCIYKEIGPYPYE